MKLKLMNQVYFSESKISGYAAAEAFHFQTLSGDSGQIMYTKLERSAESLRGSAELQVLGYDFRIKDSFTRISEQEIVWKREIKGICEKEFKDRGDGIQFGTKWKMEIEKGCQWRFCIPSMCYTKESEINKDETISYMEDRLTANLLCAYNKDKEWMYTVLKLTPSIKTDPPVRRKGDDKYLHRTQNCSIGYEKKKNGEIAVILNWPYYEGETSVAFDSRGTRAMAFYPLDGNTVEISFSYSLKQEHSSDFTKTIYDNFVYLSSILEEDTAQRPPVLPFTMEDSIEYRMTSLGKSYREFGNAGAGFFFHFNPEKGYGSLPTGFGTSFHTIPHESYSHILEYGFTGRQVNTALLMAKNRGGEWIERGKKVVHFFLDQCMTENGWLYTLYNLKTDSPFFSFGDEKAPKLHYISNTKEKGNYLRTMSEAMNDVLMWFEWCLDRGIKEEKCLNEVLLFAEFLVNWQNEDGSWYRAYKPDGTFANTEGEEGGEKKSTEEGRKAATAIPIMFLCHLCRLLEKEGLEDGIYRTAVQKAGEYVINHSIRLEHYRGGTLDNPNIEDKEAAQYAMAGMYHLYELTKKKCYLSSALKAAQTFVTWNYIWNAPTQPGTFLHEKKFKTKGFGAINSIWGGGVVDIYALFGIEELYLTGKAANDGFFCKMAEWITNGTRQIMSSPYDSMNFAEVGMQPEGFGICPQGMDEEMIKKGDIWGSLGWIYSAGIEGMEKYIHQIQKKENRK